VRFHFTCSRFAAHREVAFYLKPLCGAIVLTFKREVAFYLKPLCGAS
jgi:hypothetical protein